MKRILSLVFGIIAMTTALAVGVYLVFQAARGPHHLSGLVAIVSDEARHKGYLGIGCELAPREEAARFGYQWVIVVTEVLPDSPAESAGLRVGDLIVQVDGKALDSLEAVKRFGSTWKPDQVVQLRVYRLVEKATRAEELRIDVRLMNFEEHRNLLDRAPDMANFKAGRLDDYEEGIVVARFQNRHVAISCRDKRVFALRTVCPHCADQVRTVNWLESEQKFKCPGCGAGFCMTGVRFEGPASRALERVAIKRTQDGELEVDPGRRFRNESGQWDGPAAYVVKRHPEDRAGRPPEVSPDKPLEHWLKQLKSTNAKERAQAAWELGYNRLGSRLAPPSFKDSLTAQEKETVVSYLLEALKDQDAAIRRQAGHSLGYLESGNDKVRAALQAAANDPAPRVRVAAVGALWRITKGEVFLSAILEALKDNSAKVRLDAVQAVTFGADHKKAVAPLIALLKDPDAEVRMAAADVLSRHCLVLSGEAKEAVPALVELLGDEDSQLRGHARSGLGGIGPEAKAALPALLKALRKGENTAWAIGKIGSDGKTVIPALVGALTHKDERLRSEAAYALGRLGAEANSAAPALQKATTDKDVNVRVAARLALWRATGDEKQIGVALTEAAESKSAALGNACVWLGSIGPPGLSALVDSIKHPSAKVREMAIMGLGASGADMPKQTVPALIDAVKDSDPKVREAAARSLRGLDPEAAKKAGIKE